ncbi:MAG: M17 family peptidase N-terminal domain-containing protein, partial [Methylophaga sp.]|nr:M17 family peptidase N-terminal domain-containing protein [Methylophaga sp.]
MQYFVSSDVLSAQATDCIAVAVYEDGKLSPSAETLNSASQDKLNSCYARGDINGKAGQLLLLQDLPGINSPRVLLVGAGQQGKTTENDFNSASTAMAKWLNESAAQNAISCLSEI